MRLLRQGLAALLTAVCLITIAPAAQAAEEPVGPPSSLVRIFGPDAVAAQISYRDLIKTIRSDAVNLVSFDSRTGWIVGQDGAGKLAAAAIPSPQVGLDFGLPEVVERVKEGVPAPTAQEGAAPPSAYTLRPFLEQQGVTVLEPGEASGAAASNSGGGFSWMRILAFPLLIALIFTTFVVVMVYRRKRGLGGGGGAAGHGKMKKGALVERPTVRFDDVAGCEECVEELQEVVEFLKDPSRFAKVGARMPHGVILYGPPGTGKTLLAKAVAGEAGAAFYAVSGSDFVDTFVGVGASRVRDLFEQARRHEEGAVIFFDEIDAIGRARGNGGPGGGDSEREGTLNQLLVELDGFGERDRLMVMAATNRVDMLDAALRRPGRFDRQVQVSLPAVRGRREILAVHAKNKPIANLADLDHIAQCTAGFSGADLSNVLNEAAIMAGRSHRVEILMEDLEEGMLRSVAGPQRRDRSLADGELERIAWHEAGHALAAEMCPTHPKTQKVTIMARGQAAGLAMFGAEDAAMFGHQQLHEKMVVAMAGRAAEQLRFSTISSGAANDLEQVNRMARAAVESYGFSEAVGQIITGLAGQGMPMSEQTRQRIDEEIARMVEDAFQDATTLLAQHVVDLDALAQALLEREQLDRADLNEMLSHLTAMPLERTPRWRSAKATPVEVPALVVPVLPAPEEAQPERLGTPEPKSSDEARANHPAQPVSLRPALAAAGRAVWSARPRLRRPRRRVKKRTPAL